MAEDEHAYLETPVVLRLTGLPYSTLDYWIRTGLVEPSVRKSSGRRRARRWSVLDVVCVRALKDLRDAGAPIRLLVAARKHLQENWASRLSAQLLFWDGGDVVYLDEWDNLVSLVRHPGQSAMKVVALPVGAYAHEVEGEVVRLADLRAQRAAG